MKKLISFVLALVMIFSAAIFPTSAESGEKINAGGDVSVSGTNSFGEMVAELATEEVEKQKEGNGCNIFSVEIEECYAYVKYETTQDAHLIVAIYEEDGVKMLGSGSTEVYYEESFVYGEPAFVYLELSEMPEYFYVRAFLVNDEYAPICTAYTSSLYTREMQELMGKTTEDFEAEKILNLDTDEKTNFAVFSDDVKLIPESPLNNVTSVDDATNTYVIENIDENITELNKGDTFACKLGDGGILIVKIDEIDVSGKTATIKGADTSMEEAFDFVKIESDPEKTQISYDSEGLDSGLTFLGVSDTYSFGGGNARTSVDVSATKTLSYGIDKEFSDDFGENVTVKGEAKGTVDFSVTGMVKLFISTEEKYLEFGIDYSLAGEVSLKGSAEAKLPIGLIEIVLVPGVVIDLTPSVVIKFSAELTMGAKLSGHVGIMLSGEGKKNTTTSPALTIDPPTGKATFYLGISLEPEICLISDDLAAVSLNAELGAELTMKDDGNDGYDTEVNCKHTCQMCLAISIKGKLKGGIEAKLLNSDKLKLEVTLVDVSSDIGSYAYSFDNDLFTEGSCPFKYYKTNVKVTNSLGENMEGAKVYFTDSEGQLGDIITDENGEGTGYVMAGEWCVQISGVGYETIEMWVEVLRKTNKFEFVYQVGDNLPMMPDAVSLGEMHSAVIKEDGSLYMWGKNDRGQVGNGTTENVATPVKVLDNVVAVALGGYHSAAITEDGSLYTWGYNGSGQLGYDTYSKNESGEKISATPRKLMDGIVSVSLGSTHSAAISKTGNLYAWGDNTYGQVGNGNFNSTETEPVLIMNHVVCVDLGDKYSAAVNSDGTLYTWGYSANGQLGNDDTSHFYITPMKIMENVAKVSVGRYSSGAVTKDNKLYTWGQNTVYGLLGFADSAITVYKTPQHVANDVKDVEMGNTMTAILYTSGALYVCGANTYGQLGTGNQMAQSGPVRIMNNIEHIAAGNVHAAALDKDGNMYIWGGNGTNFCALGVATSEIASANRYWTVSSSPILIMQNVMMVEDETEFEVSLAELENSKNAKASNTFTGLEPGGIYNFYSMRDPAAEDALSPYNLLYITQVTADENGCVSVEYATAADFDGAYNFVVKMAAEDNAEEDELKKGDLNGDGNINISDMFALMVALAGGASNEFCDVNGDGNVNITDLFELKRMLV